jgi:hypothetical protein
LTTRGNLASAVSASGSVCRVRRHTTRRAPCEAGSWPPPRRANGFPASTKVIAAGGRPSPRVRARTAPAIFFEHRERRRLARSGHASAHGSDGDFTACDVVSLARVAIGPWLGRRFYSAPASPRSPKHAMPPQRRDSPDHNDRNTDSTHQRDGNRPDRTSGRRVGVRPSGLRPDKCLPRRRGRRRAEPGQ